VRLRCATSLLLLILSVFVITGSKFATATERVFQTAELTASDGVSGDDFGYSVASGLDLLAIGAPYAGGNGAVYLFRDSEGSWQQIAKLTSSDGAKGQFGFSVAIAGNTVAVGSPTQAGGAVYVFVKPPSGWADMTETAKLTNDGGGFGQGVAVNSNGSVVLAGAIFSEAAYAFRMPPGGWVNMTAPSATLVTPENTRLSGSALAISKNIVVGGGTIGNPGEPNAVFVFDLLSGSQTINSTATLTLSDGGAFGFSVAIDDDTVVAGAQIHNGNRGAVFVFVEPNGGWTDMTQTAELDVPAFGALGAAVDISKNAIVAGAPSGKELGFAVAYLKPQTGWTNTSSPDYWGTSSEGSQSEAFGQAIALQGRAVAVGNFFGANGLGAVYMFGGN